MAPRPAGRGDGVARGRKLMGSWRCKEARGWEDFWYDGWGFLVARTDTGTSCLIHFTRCMVTQSGGE